MSTGEAFRVLVAPDKFKGSLSAAEVASTIAEVLSESSESVQVVQLPIADGGEGTVALALSHGFSPTRHTVTGPLGESVVATYAMRRDLAVLEMSSAAGLALLPFGPSPRTALQATTRGVGELISHAVTQGAQRIVVGVGGSATTDGGAGALAALGLGPDAGSRQQDPLAGVDLVVACDVDNPLLGPAGAASVYAPQKGADPATVIELEARLQGWADEVALWSGADLRTHPGTGAGGGLAFGLTAMADARIASGVETLSELTGLAEEADRADLVIVGEGSLDPQSLRGKGPVGVARLATRHGTDVIAIVGRNLLSPAERGEAGLSRVYALADLEPRPEVAMRDARRLLRDSVRSVAGDWLPEAGRSLRTLRS